MLRTATHLLAALLAAAALAGCGGDPGATGGPGDDTDGGLTPVDDTPAVALGVTSEAPAVPYTPETAFSLASLTTLRVVADWTNVAPDQAQRLELRSPNGLVYYATTIPFTGATGSDRSVSALDAGVLRVVYVLEVAGTPIETYQMKGTWQVTVELDGTATAETGSFVLE